MLFSFLLIRDAQYTDKLSAYDSKIYIIGYRPMNRADNMKPYWFLWLNSHGIY